MADILITNIKGLVQVRDTIHPRLMGRDMGTLPVLENAFLQITNGRISAYGSMGDAPAIDGAELIDASGRYVFPSFVDSHTHLIFPSSREEEFVLKIKGASYADIASKGGGILNSARKLAQTSEDELFESSMSRLKEIAKTGTGAVEIKSGYGLSVEGELKILRVARRLKQTVPLMVKTTFLGAHAVPASMKKEYYVQVVINEMIPAISAGTLADYIDVFCEEGFFTVDETQKICEAGLRAGLKPRIHANQLNRSGGVQVGVKVNAVSVDHLENIGDEEIELLARSNTFPTVLPGAAFFLNLPMPPARKMLSQNLPLVIASDFNPGSSPSGNMPLMISLACIRMRLTPEEAINAATINGAAALELQNDYGSITIGKAGSVFITKEIPSIAYLPYAYGASLVEDVILEGKINPL